MSQIPDNYTPPAPITAPVMGFPVEAPQPHDHAQVPPGAPQEPSMQVSEQQRPSGHFTIAKHWPNAQMPFLLFLDSSAPPAAANRESGAERDPC